MQRFFINSQLNEKFLLTDLPTIRQIADVLRMKVGEKVIFFGDNSKEDFVYEIISIGKKNIEFKKTSIMQKNVPEIELNLFCALPNKIDKIEMILQKCTEIGIKNFIFFKSQRSQKLNITEQKKERFSTIIKEAVEQSGRNNLPKINFVDKFNCDDEFYFLHTKDEKSLFIGDVKGVKINLLVGPEGGFSEEEVSFFRQKGGKGIYLGGNILRVETACIGGSFFVYQNNFQK